MNLIAIDVFHNGVRVGRFGFYTVPRVGEEVTLQNIPSPATVKQVIHFGDGIRDDTPPPMVQIHV